jgi:7,8-dihydro-6-hydroxymethylpterin-pyrophosphokinase
MTEALLALGGNVGNSRAILDRAVFLLCDGAKVRLTARSSEYLGLQISVAVHQPVHRGRDFA